MATKSIGSNHKVVTDKDGRTRIVVDSKAQLAKLPVNKRIAARKTKANSVKFGKNPQPKR